MIKEQAQGYAVRGLKLLAKLLLSASKRVYKNHLKPRRSITLKGFVRKHSGQGLEYIRDLNKTEAKALCKELKKGRQDFILKRAADGSYRVGIISQNKTLAELLLEDIRERGKTLPSQKEKEKREPPEVQFEKGRKQAERDNAKNLAEKRGKTIDLHRHREIGAR